MIRGILGLLALAGLARTSAVYARACEHFLSQEKAVTSIQTSDSFAAWTRNADPDEYIEFSVVMSNGAVKIGPGVYHESRSIAVSGPKYSDEDYRHGCGRLLSIVRDSKLAFRSAHYLESIGVGVVHLAGNREAILDLIRRVQERGPAGTLHFSFR